MSKTNGGLGMLCSLAAGLLALTVGCVAHPRGPCGPACLTIEDASHIIEYPTQRLNILKRVAAQPELSTHEQVYLVNAVFAVGYSSDKAEALITLIRNPCCTEETCQHIRRMLKWSRLLGRDERRVIEALEKRSPTSQPQGR
jgi:hypothetical protein